MEGFKTLPKGVKAFKEGGSVYKSRKPVEKTDSADIKQDKAIVKKAFSMHDKQEHPGEKTDLSKLNKGGRAKKAVGTVKKFACGGGVYGAKKTAKDIKSIDDAKNCKPKKLAMGGMAFAAPAGQPANAPSGAMGRSVREMPKTELEKRREMEKMKRALALDPAQQGELISQDPRAAGLPTGIGNIGRKKGGKIQKCSTGGSLKETDAQENPGLAKLPTNVRNKMGYAKKGGKIKKYSGEDGSYVEPMPAPRQNFASRKPTNIAELQAEAAANSRQVPRKPSNLMEALTSEDAISVPRKPMMKKGGKAKKMNTGGTCS